MKIEFLEDSDTMSYGRVKKGDVITVSAVDGKGFINNRVAKAVKTKAKED